MEGSGVESEEIERHRIKIDMIESGVMQCDVTWCDTYLFGQYVDHACYVHCLEHLWKRLRTA